MGDSSSGVSSGSSVVMMRTGILECRQLLQRSEVTLQWVVVWATLLTLKRLETSQRSNSLPFLGGVY